MSLPGLDTSNIGFIAFWNHLDNGASDIDPSETTGELSSVTEYSNGVQGERSVNFNRLANRTVRCRVKSDGWIIAWIDRTDADFTGGSGQHGQHDIVYDWTQEFNYNTLDQNILERQINVLYNALSNSGQATYNPSDVALYNYAYPDATDISQFTLDEDSGQSLIEGTFSPNGSVSFKWGRVVGINRDMEVGFDTYSFRLTQDNTTQFNEQGNFNLTARDVITKGEVQAGSNHALGIQNDPGQDLGSTGAFVTVWA